MLFCGSCGLNINLGDQILKSWLLNFTCGLEQAKCFVTFVYISYLDECVQIILCKYFMALQNNTSYKEKQTSDLKINIYKKNLSFWNIMFGFQTF